MLRPDPRDLRISERRARRTENGFRCAVTGCGSRALRRCRDGYTCAKHEGAWLTSIEMAMARCAADRLAGAAAVIAACHCEHHKDELDRRRKAADKAFAAVVTGRVQGRPRNGFDVFDLAIDQANDAVARQFLCGQEALRG